MNATTVDASPAVPSAVVACLVILPLWACAPGTVDQEALFLAPKAAAFAAVTVLVAFAARARLAASRLDGLDIALIATWITGWLSTIAGITTLRHALPVHGFEASLLVACIALRRCALGPRLDVALWIASAAVGVTALAEACGAVWLDGIPRRPLGLLGNRNAVAGYLVVVLPFLLRPSPRAHAWRVFVALLVGAVIGLCRCRGAYVAMGVAALILVVLGRRRLRDAVAPMVATGVIAGFVLGVCVPWPGLQWNDGGPVTSLVHLVDASAGSGRGRLDEWQVGFAAWREHAALGIGPRGWGVAASLHAHAAPGQHAARWIEAVTPTSDALRWFVERGALGVLTAAAAAMLWLRRAVQAEARVWSLASGAVLAVLCVLDTPLLRGDVAALVVALVARSAGIESSPNARSDGAVMASLCGVVACVALVIGSLRAAAGVLGEAEGIAARRWADALSPSATIRLAVLEAARTPEDRRDAAHALLVLAPASWGAHLVAAGALSATGEHEASRATIRRLDALEPHWRQLAARRRSHAEGRDRSAAPRDPRAVSSPP
jgi:O-antigen ligase